MEKRSPEMRAAARTGIVLGLVIVLCAACASKKQVYIPPDWKAAPPPKVEAKPQSGPGAVSPGQGPVFKPQAEFKESDVPGTQETVVPPPQEKKPAPEQQPQHVASMHLVDQAKGNLAKGKPDAAIPVYEQAIQVDVHNGDAFLGLAKAWRLKGSRQKAMEFARKAELLFQDNPVKLKETYLFQADIYKEMGDAAKANLYKQKASRLK